MTTNVLKQTIGLISSRWMTYALRSRPRLTSVRSIVGRKSLISQCIRTKYSRRMRVELPQIRCQTPSCNTTSSSRKLMRT